MPVLYSDTIPFGATTTTYAGYVGTIPVPAFNTYRYIFSNTLTGAVIGELPLTGVDFTQSLNAAGTLNAHIIISDIKTAVLNVINSTLPNFLSIHVDRNGTIIWGGVIWARSYNSKSQTISITAREWLSYFERRVIKNTSVFTAIDQMQVAQQLIVNAQASTNGNVGCLSNVDPLSTVVSGTNVTQTYYSYELRPVFSAIQELAKQSGGFDFAIDCYYDGGGNIAKSFNTYYPRRGITYSSSKASAPVFEFPAGNVVEWTLSEDGSLTANTSYVQGAGSNEGKLIATAGTPTSTNALFESVLSYGNLTDPVVLANMATGMNKAFGVPPQTYTVVVNPSIDPAFGTYRVGDDVRVRFTDFRYPTGLDTALRIVAIKVQAGEKSPERVTLTLVIPNTSI